MNTSKKAATNKSVKSVSKKTAKAASVAIKLVGYGKKYYDMTGTQLGTLYHDKNSRTHELEFQVGTRTDFGVVQSFVEVGYRVSIRPATEKEHAKMLSLAVAMQHGKQ